MGSTVREAQGAGIHCKGGAGSWDPWREMERKPLSGILKVTGLEHSPKSTLHICWEGGGWEENVRVSEWGQESNAQLTLVNR